MKKETRKHREQRLARQRAFNVRYRAERKAAVEEARSRRGDVIPVPYDSAAPTLHRSVPGLTRERTRTVRINGAHLTLIESPV